MEPATGDQNKQQHYYGLCQFTGQYGYLPQPAAALYLPNDYIQHQQGYYVEPPASIDFNIKPSYSTSFEPQAPNPPFYKNGIAPYPSGGGYPSAGNDQLATAPYPYPSVGIGSDLFGSVHGAPQNYVSSSVDFLVLGNGQNGLDGNNVEIEKMLNEIRDFVKSPIMDFICEILLDKNREHVCSFIGPREFRIHQPNTFARMLHLAKTPFKEEKSYLKIARAMKSIELRVKDGQVVMRKVPEKRNQYKFFPDLP